MRYTYNISAQGPVTSVQTAINLIASDLQDAPTLTQDIIISVGKGTYAPFSIPDGALAPLNNSGYNLIIQPAGDYFPVIDWNKSSSTDIAGIDVGSGNPEVHIKKLWVQYCPVGIRAVTNSHNIKIEKCVVINNRNVDILIEQCRNAQVINSVIVNGDYGLVFKSCKNAAAIHNTIFMPGTITTSDRSRAGIWATAGLDFGAGLTDTGKIHLIGNLVWNTTGPALELADSDIDLYAIVSNYNDLYSGSDSLINVYSKAYTTGSPILRQSFTLLREWKRVGQGTNFDPDSISVDPKFITGVNLNKNQNLYGLDLRLLSISPLLDKVPSFFVDSTATAAWLPSYVSSSDFSTDILGNQRSTNNTVIGANETVSNQGFYGEDIFSGPLDSVESKECKLDVFEDIINLGLESLYPTFTPGYFYKQDRKFYLYAKKKSGYLSDFTRTIFELPSYVDSTQPIILYVKGKLVEDPLNYIDIVGAQLHLNHYGLNISSYKDEIELEYYSRTWKDNNFKTEKTYVVFKIEDGDSKYILPAEYKSHAPVTITDDSISLTDPFELTNQEFRVDFQDGENHIYFQHNSNLIENPKFNFWISGEPYAFESSGCSQATGTVDSPSVMGEYYASVSSGAYLKTRLPSTTGQSCFSLYHKGSGLNYEIDFFNPIDGDLKYTLSGNISDSDNWTRSWIGLNRLTGEYDSLIPTGSYSISQIAELTTPQEESQITFRISSSGQAYVDALQFETTQTPSLFHEKPSFNLLTVEFETSTGNYTDYGRALASTRTTNSDGFLFIPELSAKYFGGPNSISVTTLNDWRWPEGRFNIMPWSKVSGKEKKVQVFRNFSCTPPKRDFPVVPYSKPADAQEITINPEDPTVLQGDSNGIGLTIAAVSQEGNPLYYAPVEIQVYCLNQRFPGWLFKRQAGLKEQLGQSIVGFLDELGSINITYIPPTANAGTLSIPVPTPFITNNSDTISVVKTRYPVNLDYHGNVTVKDSNGAFLNLEATSTVTNDYESISQKNGYSQFALPYPISPGSVSIISEKIYTEQSLLSGLESNEFYVDYENSIVYIKGSINSTTISYLPRYYQVDIADPNKITFYHNKVFTNTTGNIVVDYDYVVTLQISVENPGATQSLFTRRFDLICRNQFSKSYINPRIDYREYI